MNLKQLRHSHRAATARTNPCRENDVVRFYTDFRTALLEGELDHNNFSIAAAYDEFVVDGHALRQEFNNEKRVNPFRAELMEDNGYISTTAFTNITGQIVYSRIMENAAGPAYIADRLVRTIPTQFDGEKIPGVSLIGDKAAVVAEGKPYPLAGLAEYYIETPQTIKRGLIVGVTQETIFFDRTHLVLKQAGEVGDTILLSKEKRILDAVCGISTLYRRNGAAAAATYGDTPFDNLCASNALVDYTDIENVLLLLEDMVDPITGEPIAGELKQILYPGALDMRAKSIVNATEVRMGSISGTVPQTHSESPLKGRQFELLTSPHVKARTSSSSTWFAGDFPGAFVYMENWPLVVTQAPANSEVEFTHDVVARFKVSERGAVAVEEPRKVFKSTA